MSADNGVYILRTKKGDGYEYRVAHLQAVENIDWDEYQGKPTTDDNIRINNAREMWKDAPVFASEDEAIKAAFSLHDEIEKDCGYVEYGVCRIEVEREF